MNIRPILYSPYPTAIIIGILLAWVLHEYIEPWTIETVCRELLKCD